MPESRITQRHLGGEFDNEQGFMSGQILMLQIACGIALGQTTSDGDKLAALLQETLENYRKRADTSRPGLDKSFEEGLLDCLDELIRIIGKSSSDRHGA